MKIIRGIKIGGLQQKIFNLLLLFIAMLVSVYVLVALYQQRSLSGIVTEASSEQQGSITALSEETMEAVLDTAMTRTTALQAYIADDLFSDVRTDVRTLQAFVEELFAHQESFPAHEIAEPKAGESGTAAIQVLHEEGVDPARSRSFQLVSNMAEIMLAMFEASDKMSGCYVGTADGALLFVNDRAEAYLSEDGTTKTLDVRNRPWYVQAAAAGEMIFTGVEADAYTGIPTLECAAPVYHNGKLVAVVGADVFLTAIDDYVESISGEDGFVCVVNENGQILFSPQKSGSFAPGLSREATDLRTSENEALASFVSQALTESTGLQQFAVDGREYYLCGTPMPTVGWAVLSVTDRAVMHQPTDVMLSRYEEINGQALSIWQIGAKHSLQMIAILTTVIVVLAVIGALAVAQRIVGPIEAMTKRVNALKDGDTAFEMDDAYRTGDEIEILAESFATLSKRTREYIARIMDITAEKERIGAELALATRIQESMLPSITPEFPNRPEFDLYASMDPAKEVGGDFYDFYMIDDDHMGLTIADVSGKGVPAALFMAISKALLKNRAQMGGDPATVLSQVNDQLCSNEDNEMFVTVWLGILTISTGEIVCANAGHEYPAICHGTAGFSLAVTKHGPPLGIFEGVEYQNESIALAPGDRFFVYTDGVPEATAADREMFGTERMLAALNEGSGASPEETLKRVRTAVDGFVKEAEQFDDLTMLGMTYKGVTS